MFNKNRVRRTSIVQNDQREGETIEQKVDRIVNNGDPITDGAPLIFTEREEGVLPGFNPRTDRFEEALGAMDKITGDKRAKREARIDEQKKVVEEYNAKQKGDGEAKSTQGSNENPN